MFNWCKLLFVSILGIWGGTIVYTNDVQKKANVPEKVKSVANGMFWYRMIGLICVAYFLSIMFCAVAFILLVGGGTE